MKRILNKLIIRKYSPKAFWDNWATSFMGDSWQVELHPQHKWLLKIIKSENPASILEVGCGFGRNIKYLIDNGIDASKIEGFDISSNMIAKAKKYINNRHVKLWASDLLSNKSKNKYDLVFTHGVLMHVEAKKVGDAIDNLKELSSNSLVMIEQNYKADNNYTFVHDYRSLLSSREIDIIEYRSSKKLGLDLIYAKVR